MQGNRLPACAVCSTTGTDAVIGSSPRWSRRTLSRWLHEGIGPPSIKLPSGARRYRRGDLDRWVAEHQADG
jgi:hypothetical protein